MGDGVHTTMEIFNDVYIIFNTFSCRSYDGKENLWLGCLLLLVGFFSLFVGSRLSATTNRQPASIHLLLLLGDDAVAGADARSETDAGVVLLDLTRSSCSDAPTTIPGQNCDDDADDDEDGDDVECVMSPLIPKPRSIRGAWAIYRL